VGAVGAVMLDHVRSAGRRALARVHDRSKRVLARSRGRVLILAYHRVLPASAIGDQFVQPGMYVTPAVLETHVRFLRRHFRIISFGEFLRLQESSRWEPDVRYCLITFDDGWLDNYTYAYPVLRRYGVPATIFVSTALVGSEEWMWPDKLGWLLTRASGQPGAAPAATDAIIERWKRLSDRTIVELLAEMAKRFRVSFPRQRVFLDWDQIREMSAGGIAFGSHGATHRLLPGLSAADMCAEIAGSMQRLHQELESPLPVFCYPNGDHDDAVVGHVQASGYRAAVSTVAGAEVWDQPDRFRLRRIGVHNDVSADVPRFALHLSRVGGL
jgi:peptidoglycan/xylan/chitin deacetylase (PgdA/CDA1 family)